MIVRLRKPRWIPKYEKALKKWLPKNSLKTILSTKNSISRIFRNFFKLAFSSVDKLITYSAGEIGVF
jgi:hypothetical protein